jgi:serine/threonine-protein kinase
VLCGRSLPGVGPGDLVDSRYRILEQLGAGGMGIVFKADDEKLGETVALKLLRVDGRLGTLAGRFRSEIRLARKVRHENVCAIHEYGEDGELLYISMELIDGQDLKRALRETGPIGGERGYEVALQVAAGLAAIHKAGVIHRDLKAANIMRDAKGVVRVMDFGIAKAWHAETGEDLTKTGHVVGSPQYMSPEQIRGLTLDARSDLYSFGIVLFEIFTGQLPFVADTPVEVMHMHLKVPPPLEVDLVPPPLVPILARALAKNRDERYATVADMARELEAARRAFRLDRTAPIPAPGPIDAERVRRLARLVVPQLLRALGNASAIVRRDAALALGSTGSDDTAIRTALEKACEDDDPGVRLAASNVLERLVG